MLYFRDAFTGDLVLSDAYPSRSIAGGFVREVIPDSHDAFIRAFRLEPCPFGKKDYAAHMKTYILRVKDRISQRTPGRAPDFVTFVASWSKEVVAMFDEYCLFSGVSQNVDAGMVIIAHRTEDGRLKFQYVEDGLTSEPAIPGIDPWAAHDARIDEPNETLDSEA
jgi:hypothetical protein